MNFFLYYIGLHCVVSQLSLIMSTPLDSLTPIMSYMVYIWFLHSRLATLKINFITTFML
jgi:hypothetical protein